VGGMYRKEEVTVENAAMEILVFEPDGDGPFPAVIVAQHLPVAHAGLETDPFTLDVGERLAAEGYVAVIPFLFYRWPRDEDMMVKAKAWCDDSNLADLDATYEFTSALSAVDPERIGIVGHCWGGRVSFLAACTNPRYAAAAVFYGGRIGIGLGPDSVPPLEMVGQIECPVLGIFGNEDQNPSPDDVVELERALTHADVVHEFHQYDGAGHGFQDFVNEDRYRPDQTADAWQKFFAFMSRHLG
jgi:carboxymethylenebutenolidase